MNKLRLTNIFFCCVYLFMVAYPFFDAYIMGGVSFDQQVDPELMTGLLTASSILFGFSSLIILRPEFGVEEKKWLWLLILPPLALTIQSGSSIGMVALGKGDAVRTTLILISSFNANVLTTAFLVGFYFLRKKR